MRLYYFPAEQLDISTGAIQTTIHSNGHIGWGDLQQTVGQGFIFQGQDLLPEQGLLIGRSPDQISDNLRNENNTEQDTDFRSRSVLETKSNPIYRGDIYHSFDDLNGENPMGLIIEQELLFGSASIPVLDRSVAMIYKIHNPTDSTISDISLGVFADWDLHSEGLDEIEYDANRKLVIFNNSGESPARYAGLLLANNEHDIIASIIDNDTSLGDGFTDEAKWEFLSTSHSDDLTGANGSAMLSVAPFDLIPHHSIPFMYSLIVATSLSDLVTTAGTIQSIYDTAFALEYVGIDDQAQQQSYRLVSNYPNPFNPSTTIAYELPQASQVSLKVYDISGRFVISLNDAPQQAGYHTSHWNGLDHLGNQVSTGVYFAQLQVVDPAKNGAGDFSKTIKMMYLK